MLDLAPSLNLAYFPLYFSLSFALILLYSSRYLLYPLSSILPSIRLYTLTNTLVHCPFHLFPLPSIVLIPFCQFSFVFTSSFSRTLPLSLSLSLLVYIPPSLSAISLNIYGRSL